MKKWRIKNTAAPAGGTNLSMVFAEMETASTGQIFVCWMMPVRSGKG